MGTRNDPAQYDVLVDEWWRPRGAFSGLHWLAVARAELIPPPRRDDAVLLDVACGGGLLTPHVTAAGYRHVGIDLSASAVRVARDHGLADVLRADAAALPFAAGTFDVVVAGEILEHVPDLPATVAECCRVLRAGGTLVIDTIAATALARFLAITVTDHLPGIAPKDLHDPALLVDRAELTRLCAAAGVPITLRGLRPVLADVVGWLLRRRDAVRLTPMGSTAVVFQASGVKSG